MDSASRRQRHSIIGPTLHGYDIRLITVLIISLRLHHTLDALLLALLRLNHILLIHRVVLSVRAPPLQNVIIDARVILLSLKQIWSDQHRKRYQCVVQFLLVVVILIFEVQVDTELSAEDTLAVEAPGIGATFTTQS